MKTLTTRGITAATPAQKNLLAATNLSEGWERTRYVASSVEQTNRDGIRIQPFGPAGKLLIDDAAELIGVPTPTIKRELKAWNLAAIAGLCVSSGGLTPEAGQTASLPEADLWNMYWNQAA